MQLFPNDFSLNDIFGNKKQVLKNENVDQNVLDDNIGINNPINSIE